MFEAGVGIFFGVHLIPLIEKLKLFLKNKFGENLYMGLFSLVSLAGLLLIIFGYESNSNFLYSENESAYLYSKYIMFIAFTLLIAANLPTYIKKTTKHPMSLGIAAWAVLHLMVSPDTSSIILFGSFLSYSIVSVLMSELRGSQVKEINPKISLDILSVALAIFINFLAYNFHEYLSGITLG
ncbi:uncharacterized protein METZ01_LOCUS112716 [marine metagenome]|uniref:NnrU domain-containing protein n=1 Tax=marine metagenome TaxID=408172 RepID=A0A381X5M6_9ZZZZ